MKKHLRVLCILLTVFAGNARAQLVVPWYYKATPGEGRAQTGSYDYFDETGKQLTDNIIGTNDLEANLGNGIAYEWVGWIYTNPTVTFHFSNTVSITSVQIGFNHAPQHVVFVPSRVIVGGDSYTLSGSELPNGTRGFLNFSGSWCGTNLTIQLFHDDQGALPRCIFVDEVRFVGQPGGICADIYTAVEVCWNSQSNKLYQVEYKTEVDTNQWYSFGPSVLATNAQSCVLDTTRNNPRKFYRVRELP